MDTDNLSKILRQFLAAFGFAICSAHGQVPNDALKDEVNQLIANRNYASIAELVDEREALWKTTPNRAYFRDMGTIAFVLTGQPNEQMYWLGRKVIWKVLVKPAPREVFAAGEVYSVKQILLSDGAENFVPYFAHVSRQMYAAIRHDTFLMLSEWARQLHAEIIPGYKPKWAGAMETDMKPFEQNRIDNQVQGQDKSSLHWLAEYQDDYLIMAYSKEPRNDEELKQLLDILGVPAGKRANVIGRVTQGN